MNIKSVMTILITGFFLVISSMVQAVMVNDRIPDFEITTIDGKIMKSSEIIGNNPLFLVFWASWCTSCKEEIPHLNKLVKQFGGKGMVFLGVNVGIHESEDKVNRFAKKYKMNYPVYFDQDSSLTRKFKISGTPSIIIVDKSGIVRYRDITMPEDLAVYIDGFNR